MSGGKIPKVTVCVITYNQEKYIAQCLQSIVDQKTDFLFDVVVGEDCSTDGTREIVRYFEKKYPGIIKPIYQKENIGRGVHNFLTVHAAATGDYIAHVDGDDYCLPGKLQAQADLLDRDPVCNIVFHRMYALKASGAIIEGPLFEVDKLTDLKFYRSDFLQFMAIGGHSSKMYRRSVRDYAIPSFDVIDYFVNVEQVKNGYARFVSNECFGVYRLGGAITTEATIPKKALAKSFLYFRKKYPEFRSHINTAALTCFVADAKNLRKTCFMFFCIWLRTFSWKSIPNMLISLKFLRWLRIG